MLRISRPEWLWADHFPRFGLWLEDTNADKVAAIVAARAKGTGIRRIARELGVGVGTVLRVTGEGAGAFRSDFGALLMTPRLP